MSVIDIDHETGCWNWQGSLTAKGYARFKRGGKTYRVSRVILGLTDPNVLACHTCDNPSCVNPDHLFPASNSENMRDMVEKGRQARGSRHGMSTYTKAAVQEMHLLHFAGFSNKDIASRFGILPGAVWQVVSGKRWKDVYDDFHGMMIG